MRYAVVVERVDASFGACVPYLPSCAAVGETREEAVKLIHEAIEAHVEMLRKEREPMPEPRSTADCARVTLS